MDAMNVGGNDASGRIVGLIHEMFVREGRNWFESGVPTELGMILLRNSPEFPQIP